MFSSEFSVKHFKSSHSVNLLDLPELVLHNICSHLSSPFDLLNFGNSCRKLYRISSSQSLWHNLCIQWLSGLWHLVEPIPSFENDSRAWFLNVLHNVEMNIPNTKTICNFLGGEEWVRADPRSFRCKIGLLQLSYADRLKESHPGVLYEKWLFDIGLYRRREQQIHFERQGVELSKEDVFELASLGQAKERDLRARKQPYIDPKYYVKIMSSSAHFDKELFPHNFHGSICPLLMCPFHDAVSNEVSGISGLFVCLTLVLEKHLIAQKFISLPRISITIKAALKSFLSFLNANLDVIKRTWTRSSLTNAVENLAMCNMFDLGLWQASLDDLRLNINSKKIMFDVHLLLVKYGSLDNVVDRVRRKWRIALMNEIENVLRFGNSDNSIVTRVNLTDSDLIGGDNHRQEMSSAAFVSEFGVLVTWHLIGRLRY